MRLPWIQVHASLIERVPQFASILSRLNKHRISNSRAMGMVTFLCQAVLETRADPADDYSSPTGIFPGDEGVTQLVDACFWEGDPDHLVQAIVRAGIGQALSDGGVRIKGASIYEKAFKKLRDDRDYQAGKRAEAKQIKKELANRTDVAPTSVPSRASQTKTKMESIGGGSGGALRASESGELERVATAMSQMRSDLHGLPELVWTKATQERLRGVLASTDPWALLYAWWRYLGDPSFGQPHRGQRRHWELHYFFAPKVLTNRLPALSDLGDFENFKRLTEVSGLLDVRSAEQLAAEARLKADMARLAAEGHGYAAEQLRGVRARHIDAQGRLHVVAKDPEATPWLEDNVAPAAKQLGLFLVFESGTAEQEATA